MDPSEPRAAARLEAERIYLDLGATILRAAGIYGPGRGLHRRIIAGTFHLPGTGENTVSRIHVTDLAHAHVMALGRLLAGAPSLAVNLGTGRGHSVREIIAAVERISGRRVPVREAPRRAGDPPQLIAACGRAETLLGWRPRYPDIDTIVETAWRWHRRHADARRTTAAAAGAAA